MKYTLSALILSIVLLSSCTTQSYLSQSNHVSADKMGLIATKTALERPNICVDPIHIESSTNRAKTIEDFEKIKLQATVNNIIAKANTFIGTPYRYGGTTRRGIDCSSFMQQIYEVEGIKLPRVSAHQAKTGIPVSKGELKRGDLVFFSTTSRYRVTHVGMVVDVNGNDITFIHAASSKGVSKASLNHPYWKSRYRSARRPEKLAYSTNLQMANLYNDSVRTLASSIN